MFNSPSMSPTRYTAFSFARLENERIESANSSRMSMRRKWAQHEIEGPGTVKVERRETPGHHSRRSQKSPALLDGDGQIEETTVRVSHTSQALRIKSLGEPENAAPELCPAVLDGRIAFTFRCAGCGGLILEPSAGNLTWQDNENGELFDLQAFHKKCDNTSGRTSWIGLDCILLADQRGSLTRLLDGEPSIEAAQ
jgi:hypothetical protein